MQTRVDAEIVVLFKAEVKSQDIRNMRYRTAGKRIGQIEMFIKTRNQNFGVTGKD